MPDTLVKGHPVHPARPLPPPPSPPRFIAVSRSLPPRPLRRGTLLLVATLTAPARSAAGAPPRARAGRAGGGGTGAAPAAGGGASRQPSNHAPELRGWTPGAAPRCLRKF